jgi:hypothetical protein
MWQRVEWIPGLRTQSLSPYKPHIHGLESMTTLNKEHTHWGWQGWSQEDPSCCEISQSGSTVHTAVPRNWSLQERFRRTRT